MERLVDQISKLKHGANLLVDQISKLKRGANLLVDQISKTKAWRFAESSIRLARE